VARDLDTIQREIEQARDALAGTLDVLSERANPKRLVDSGKQLVDSGKQSAYATLAEPKVKYTLIGVGALLGLSLLRKLLR
jgi:hypothetical protein